jgi:hypothetical protein
LKEKLSMPFSRFEKKSESQALKLKVSIDELQLESTSLKSQTMVTVDASTDCAHGKVI